MNGGIFIVCVPLHSKAMLRRITGRRLLTPIGSVEYPVITVDAAGLIEDISSEVGTGAEGILTPVFLDAHIHGCANHDVMEGTAAAFEAVGRFLAGKGVGGYLATTVTAPVDRTLRSLEGMADAIEAGPRAGSCDGARDSSGRAVYLACKAGSASCCRYSAAECCAV